MNFQIFMHNRKFAEHFKKAFKIKDQLHLLMFNESKLKKIQILATGLKFKFLLIQNADVSCK